MKHLYITSVERYSGKTATCLALGKHLQAAGYKVGYLKPLSLQPWRVAGEIADEDADFVKKTLGLTADVWELSPVVLTPSFLRVHLVSSQHHEEADGVLMGKVLEAVEILSKDKDIMILEGGGSLREGYLVGLPTPAVAAAIGGSVLVLVKYRDEVRVLDDALTAQSRLGDLLAGVIINRVPSQASGFVNDVAIPFLENRGIPVLGVLPEVATLAALTVAELVKVLKAEVVTECYAPDALVETLTVGAMTTDAALRRFRKQTNKAVITGGDRTDIQLAALETSTTCLVLTGNLSPSPLVVKQADEFGVCILLVRSNTMETIEAIESVFGKSRLGQPVKLQQFEALLETHMDYRRLYQHLGLKRAE
jgi:BioD-like phosphotransacetylase family protein